MWNSDKALYLRLLAVNGAALGGVLLAYIYGLIDRLVKADPYGFSIVVTLTMLYGLSLVFRSVSELTKSVRMAEHAKIADYFEGIRSVKNWVFILGILGTMIGFIIGLEAIDFNNLKDVAKVGPSLGGLAAGLKMALYKSAVGFMSFLLLDLNYRSVMSYAIRKFSSHK